MLSTRLQSSLASVGRYPAGPEAQDPSLGIRWNETLNFADYSLWSQPEPL